MSAASPRSAPSKVTDQFFIERYSQVMHIVSNVEGKLARRPRCRSTRWPRAFRPAPSPGAPKVRAMEIIDELEKEKRGLYAGCVGYFSAAGDMDTCIVLRTALVKDGKMYVQAGAGIVADSDPGIRAAGMHQQGEGAVPRRRGSPALRQRRRQGTVGSALASAATATEMSRSGAKPGRTNHSRRRRCLRPCRPREISFRA